MANMATHCMPVLPLCHVHQNLEGVLLPSHQGGGVQLAPWLWYWLKYIDDVRQVVANLESKYMGPKVTKFCQETRLV
jgi:hypothetical protein